MIVGDTIFEHSYTVCYPIKRNSILLTSRYMFWKNHIQLLYWIPLTKTLRKFALSHVTSSYVILSTLPLGMKCQKNLLSHPLQKNFPNSGLKDHIYTDQCNRKEFRNRPTQIRPIFFTKDQFKEKSNLFNKWWSKWNPYRKK